MNLKSLTCFLVFSAFAFFLVGPAQGDEIKLKNGETLNGKITYEGDDLVKIEMAVSGTIKQTRNVARVDILEIIKDAPDNVAFAKLQNLLPTPSLLPASRYEVLLETGPAAFLRSFPESTHVPKVKEIQDTLETELDKVERGFIKVEDEWISPQDRAEFAALTESKIALLKMKSAVRARNYNGYISALREFETLEEKYYGSPAFPVALNAAKEIIPAFGNQLQTMLRNVEYLNQQYEQNLSAMDELARAQVAEARQKEVENYKAGVEADKKEGIKWVRLDPRSKPAIESYLKLASDELVRIQEYDVSALERQADMLVKADQQAAGGDLTAARATLKQAAAITGKSAGSSRRGSAGSYIAAISAKISDKEAKAKAEAKAREEALASEALTANLKPSGGGDTEDAGEEAGEGGEEVAETEEEKPVDEFAALANPGKKGDKKEAPKASEKPKSKPKPKPKPEEREEERPRPTVVEDSGGGIPISRIIQIVTGLLLVTVVVLKVMGKKG